MDTNNWRPTPASGEPTMDTGEWRTQLQPDSRQRIVNKIMDTLKRHLPFSGQEGLNELRKIAVRFEEKIFTAANSQSDYLRRISLKMLTMENKSQNTIPNTGNNSKAPDPGCEGMQNQVHSQGQSIPFPLQSNKSQAHQQLLPQSVPNNMSSAGVQSSTGLQSGMPSVSGPTQNSIPNVVGQNSNMQNLSEISQNSLGQGISSNICTNHQRQMQGRQQVLPQQQQHLCLQGSKLPAPDTPGNGMSTSPLLAGFENANDTHSNALTTDFGESKDTEEPHVPRVTMFQAKPMSLKSLEASVVPVVEEAATAVGVDMAALSKGGLHRRNFFPQTGMTGAEKMRFYMSALAILALMFWFIIIASA